jgi:hypothetical protein
MSDRQTLNVRNITQALRDVNQWHSLGVALGIAGHKLEAIGLDNPNQTQRCKFDLFGLWLRTDVTASWAKLAAALDEAELDKAAGRIKEQYLGIPSTSPVPPEVIAAASARRGVTAVRQGVAVGVGIVPQPVMTQTPATRGHILADGPVVLQPGASNVPVPISAQAPITTIKDALPLLQTSQEQLIRTLTHSKMDVNSTGEAQNVTLLHRAAMVHVHMLICRLLFFPWLPSKPVYSTTGRILYTPSRHLMCTYVYTYSDH